MCVLAHQETTKDNAYASLQLLPSAFVFPDALQLDESLLFYKESLHLSTHLPLIISLSVDEILEYHGRFLSLSYSADNSIRKIIFC